VVEKEETKTSAASKSIPLLFIEEEDRTIGLSTVVKEETAMDTKTSFPVLSTSIEVEGPDSTKRNDPSTEGIANDAKTTTDTGDEGYLVQVTKVVDEEAT
jgi:hypothetical protein